VARELCLRGLLTFEQTEEVFHQFRPELDRYVATAEDVLAQASGHGTGLRDRVLGPYRLLVADQLWAGLTGAERILNLESGACRQEPLTGDEQLVWSLNLRRLACEVYCEQRQRWRG
jgi:hypothetical protein